MVDLELPPFGDCTTDGTCTIQTMTDLDVFMIQRFLSECGESPYTLDEARKSCALEDVCGLGVISTIHDMYIERLGSGLADVEPELDEIQKRLFIDKQPAPEIPDAQVIAFRPRTANG